ncbi:UMP kinase [Candidatus Woesearchaeota archaeon]|nr:UMP kinase [Candidatus Woesearchaeota archaeon]
MQTIVISLGGSIIVPEKIDTGFLKKFKKLILKHSKKRKIVIVCGGGKTSRKYGNAAMKISKPKDYDLDLIGIRATKLNAELVRVMFGNHAHKEVIENPTKKIKTKKNIIMASGWIPGFSSDTDAVLLAKNLKAKKLINLSNISYAYTKDPKKYKDAKKIKQISWKDFQKIVGTKWKANTSSPFDPEASKKARQLKLTVIVAKGTDLKNLDNILSGKEFKGTIIKN